ncbi:MAG: DNA repair protein RecN [Prevotella sp.]|nr:DNA repair protein RecN [Prevotella sp.]
MIKQLYIKNFTLIDELNMQLFPGFSVITGETGAGKSIILGAIGLLLGQRADSKSIKTGKDRCTIEAHFDISRYDMSQFFHDNDIDYDADDCILRRELTAAGKSRAFVNDTPVSLQQMRELGEKLVDVHSQHQNLLLNKENFQLSVVDILADDARELTDYREAFLLYRETARQLEQLKDEIAQNRQNEDFMRFQHDELSAAKLEDGEQERLEAESETLNHAEDIKSALYETDNNLSGDNGVVEQLRQASYALHNIEKVFGDVSELAARMESSYIELKDIAGEIGSKLDSVDFDPSHLDAINDRLDHIYTLQQKYHVTTVQELIDIERQLGEKLSQIDNSDEQLQQLEQQMEKALQQAEQKAKTLTRKRQQAAKTIEQQMKQRLVPLGIPNVRFQVSIEPKPISTDGADRVAFLFSANKSTPLQPVAQVASGGEIARVMLSLKAMISGTVKLPTIIFDEIDTGVSGKIAESMAHIMQEMGSHERQVISITHLPQIAARGTNHYKVEKTETPKGTLSTMTLLTSDQRIEEIAQMLSGANVSEAALQNARELLGVRS